MRLKNIYAENTVCDLFDFNRYKQLYLLLLLYKLTLKRSSLEIAILVLIVK